MSSFLIYIRNYFRGIDSILLTLCIVCPAIGFVLVYSATQNTNNGMRNVIVQSVCFFIGLALMFIVSNFDFEIYLALAKYIFIFFMLALIVTYFLADNVGGNRNWIDLKIIKIQPSEVAKIGFVVTMTAHLTKVREEINSPLTVLVLGLHFCCYAGLVALQGDVGSMLVYLIMFLVMLFIGGLRPLYFVGAAIAGGISTPFLWSYALPDYMKKRILTSFNPELDPQVVGYQAIQSKTALGSGGLFGSGLFKGIQTQYNLLPAKHTDFIFSVAGEELGFIGCIVILLLLFFIIFRISLTGIRSEDERGILICAGVATMIAAQAIENVGMCVGLLPVIGITLPFISYGGSSLMSVFFAMGLVQSVAIHSRKLTINFRNPI